MKIYVYPADKHGCGHYRLIWPAEAMRAQGHDVVVMDPDSRELAAHITGGKVEYVRYPSDADVMVFQRTTHEHLAKAIEWMVSQGKKIIVDVDDDLETIHPRNPAWTSLHPRYGGMHSWHHLRKACQVATLVTCSTDTLVHRYASHGRGVVIPNCVPRSYLDVEHVDSDVIGWAASLHSHPDDADVARTSVSRLVTEGASFWIAGNPTGMGKAFLLPRDPEGAGIIDLPDWPTQVTRLGIGIAPLAPTRFNESKSWLKPLEYSALGVPWVASPGKEYLRFHALTKDAPAGLIARKPKDWYRHLTRLRNDPVLRKELGENGRRIAERLTIEGNVDRWVDAWTVGRGSA